LRTQLSRARAKLSRMISLSIREFFTVLLSSYPLYRLRCTAEPHAAWHLAHAVTQTTRTTNRGTHFEAAKLVRPAQAGIFLPARNQRKKPMSTAVPANHGSRDRPEHA
jgi:hypothetical protein